MVSMSQKTTIIYAFITSAIVSALIVAGSMKLLMHVPKIGYVANPKVMIGFNEASRVDKIIAEEREKGEKKLKEAQDTVNARINLLSSEYDRASAQRKKELQDLLAEANQRANNLQRFQEQKLQQLQSEKSKPVIDKMNLYLQEYGKKHKYDVIIGTGTGGTLLYGSIGYDLTDEIIKGLNERYK